VCLAAARPARGDDLETAKLAYSSRVASCPNEESFRHLVAARLGYEPFTPDGRHRVSVALRLDRNRLRGRAEIARAGQPSRARELAAEPDQCDSLVAALATAVAIAIDPARSAQATPPSPSIPPHPPDPVAPSPIAVPPTTAAPPPIAAPPIAPSAIAPPPPSPALAVPPAGEAPPTARPSTKLFASLDGVAALGLAPGGVAGGELDVGVRVSSVSLALLGRLEATLGASRVSSGDRLEATIASGGIVPCLHPDPWTLCVPVRVGVFEGRAPDVVAPSLGKSLFGAVGGRAGYELPLVSGFALRALASAEVPTVRTSLIVDHRDVWTAPAVFGGVQLGVLVTLP
jgi:hypothetical protein